MQGYGVETYGDRWADVYDTWVGDRFSHGETAAAVDVLGDLAAGGRVLELGIGTGRIALPLAQRGLEVHGIEASEAMVTKLRAKPGGDAISITIGSFADVDFGSSDLDLVFVVWNTFFALTSQEEQIRCFKKVAGQLSPQGKFVIEAFVPNLARFAGGHSVQVLRVTADQVGLAVSENDPVAQTIESQHLAITEDGVQLRPVHLRYAWPSELDLMARLAGLELRSRWGGWDRSPFTGSSGTHVSVYAQGWTD